MDHLALRLNLPSSAIFILSHELTELRNTLKTDVENNWEGRAQIASIKWGLGAFQVTTYVFYIFVYVLLMYKWKQLALLYRKDAQNPCIKHTFVGLKLVDLVLGVSKLRQVSTKLSLVARALLGAGDGLVHAWGAADEDLDVLLLGAWQDSLEQLGSDHTLGARPALRWVVQDVEGAESLRVLVLQLLELALQQDVLLGDVSEDEGDLGLIFRVLEDGACELVHGCNAGATCNQGNVLVLVGFPGVLGNGSLHVEPLAGIHVVQVLGHGAVGITLYEKVDVAWRVWKKQSV